MMQMRSLKLALPALVVLGFAAMTTEVRASFIQLTNSYFQDFNSLPNSGKPNFSFPGWAIASQDGKLYADNGNGTMANIYSYGANGSTDRALGALTSGGNAPIFGASFQNSGAGAMNRLNISYTGEEWRLGVAGHANTLQFSYSLNASGVKDNNATWINVPSLGFTTPNLVGVGAHDGNLAANRTQIAGTISFLNIAPGQTFWIRWQQPGGGMTFVGDGLAVDNFSISAVPETSTALAGFGALGLIAGGFWKRRSVKLQVA